MADTTNWSDYWSGLSKSQDYYNGNSSDGNDGGSWTAPDSATAPSPSPSQSATLSGTSGTSGAGGGGWAATTPSSAFSTGDWTDANAPRPAAPAVVDSGRTLGPGGPRPIGAGISPVSLATATPSGGDLSGFIGSGSGFGYPGYQKPPASLTGGNVRGPIDAGVRADSGFTSATLPPPFLGPPTGFGATGTSPFPGFSGGPPTAAQTGQQITDAQNALGIITKNSPPVPTGPPTLTGQNQYFNSYTGQYQQTPPVNPTGSGLATVNNTGGFVPSFLSGQQVTGPGANGSGQKTGAQNLNPQYYATQESANWLATQLGPGYSVVQNPDGYAPGLTAPGSTFSFPNAYMIRFPDGHTENAGQMLQPYTNGSATAQTLSDMRNGGSTLQRQQALMPLSPSVRPGDYQQTGGPGNPITYSPQALTSQAAYVAANPPQPPPPAATATPPVAVTPQQPATAASGGIDPNLLAYLQYFSNLTGGANTGSSGNSLLDYLMQLTGSSNGSANSSGNGLQAIFDALMGQSNLYQRRRQYPQFA